ncbi:MAG: glycoside hydrolase family 97 protein [Pseudomonadota bacterium]
MRMLLMAWGAFTILIVASCATAPSTPIAANSGAAIEPAPSIETPAAVSSPSGHLSVSLTTQDGQLRWQAEWRGQTIISPSRLGLAFKAGHDLNADLQIAAVEFQSRKQTWEQPWGERQFIQDQHNELAAEITFSDGRPAFVLRIRAFDDGLGFRYEVPDNGYRELVDEQTEFRLDPAAKTWWIPAAGWNRYEELYQQTALSDVPRAHTPMTVELGHSGPFISIHEAALVDYAGMWLNQRRPGTLEAELAPWSDGTKVKVDGAFKTPWRTLQISDTAAGLANSDLILNLNEPNALGDVSWAKPSKYVGIWWCMHIEECTWGSGAKHGATTARTREYIDFAAEHGFDGVLVEGWNFGWDGDWFSNGEIFSFTKAYADFDLEGLAAYAQERGVYLIGHHETSGAITNYEEQIEAAYALYQRLGIPAIKTGYVADGGEITRRDANGKVYKEWHDGQFAVNHHLRALKLAAQYGISLNAHEPVKDTGLRRTYPNAFSREGARGQEYNAWGQPPNDPAHTTILPFTRMLSGPMDFTPGIFDLTFGKDTEQDPRVQTTLAKQLALYVLLHSPIQMAADLPRNYLAQPEAFEFIKQVPVDWSQSIMLDGYPGDFAVMARKDRNSQTWYIGAVSDEQARTVDIPLTFLDGQTYEANIWADGESADWRSNPYPLNKTVTRVTSTEILTLHLAAGGGAAIQLIPVK